jgi:PhnB protein
MPTSLVPYLNFPGNAREAMEFYQSIFGGTLEVVTFADFNLDGMPPDGTMHAYLKADGFNIAASDAMPGAESTWGGTRVYLSFMGDDESIVAWFDKLAEGGEVGQPLARQVWGASYGLVKDKFGLEWMFNIGPSGE